MGVNRYSAIPNVRKRQQYFDHLQWRCSVYGDPLTIGELRTFGITRAEWQCRTYECLHRSEMFKLSKFGERITVSKLRWKFVCSRCGTKRPEMRLIWDE